MGKEATVICYSVDYSYHSNERLTQFYLSLKCLQRSVNKCGVVVVNGGVNQRGVVVVNGDVQSKKCLVVNGSVQPKKCGVVVVNGDVQPNKCLRYPNLCFLNMSSYTDI